MASSLLLLAACAGRTKVEPEIQYREAAVAVAVGCVVDRPAPVAPLNQQVPAAEWAARAPGAKAQAMRAQAGRRLNYEDRLAASTASCSPR
ncbi:hypothetical protein ACU5AX_09050 [Sphingomonas sp. XXL09]|uniref:hypothetical protein n=1 Tax=Sphingomonas sp. XXL09 TaxID=3457787 RepID=UPI00406BCE40